jgi:hypothetical protein
VDHALRGKATAVAATPLNPAARSKVLTRIRLQLAIYFWLHRGSLTENTAKWQASLWSMKPRPEFRPGLHPARLSKRLPFHLVFLWCATIVLTIGSTVLYTFTAVSAAFLKVSIAFSTSQPCCFLFVFLRFIFSSNSVVLARRRFFLLFLPLFLPFPCGSEAVGKLLNWWKPPRCLPWETSIESPLANGNLVRYKSLH